jgi:hypothetical protein
MKKLILAAAAIAAFGLILPVASTVASAQTLMIGPGHGHNGHVDRGHRRGHVERGYRRGAYAKPHHRHGGWNRPHREGRNDGVRVIVR